MELRSPHQGTREKRQASSFRDRVCEPCRIADPGHRPLEDRELDAVRRGERGTAAERPTGPRLVEMTVNRLAEAVENTGSRAKLPRQTCSKRRILSERPHGATGISPIDERFNVGERGRIAACGRTVAHNRLRIARRANVSAKGVEPVVPAWPD